MSLKAMTWAYDQPITPPGLKFVLVTLANYADENGFCYPSHKRIADDTGMTKRSVISHLATLEELGIIHQEHRHRKNHSQTSNGYWLTAFATDIGEDPTGGGENISPPREKSSPHGVKSFHPPSENISPPEPPSEPLSKPSLENTIEHPSDVISGEAVSEIDTPDEKPPLPHIVLFEAFMDATGSSWDDYQDRVALSTELKLCKSLHSRGYTPEEVRDCTRWCLTWANVVGMKLVSGQINDWKRSGKPTTKGGSRTTPEVPGAGGRGRISTAAQSAAPSIYRQRPPDPEHSLNARHVAARRRKAQQANAHPGGTSGAA